MNREIKYRGKKLLTDEWVYGYLISASEIRVFITDEWEGQYEDFIVDPETVGEFTGLTDKNGVEIYKGDILNVCNGSINLNPWMEKPFSVEYKLNKGFIMPMYCWDDQGKSKMDKTHWCEVIGNIHQNPELFKTE